MKILWNCMELDRPPNARWRTTLQKFDVKKLLVVLENIISELNSQKALHTEAATLSRLIYRMKTKFRNDKGLKSMCKLNKAMLNYLSLSVAHECNNLKSYIEIDGKFVDLPTRQMLEFVLVRLQGFAKLLERIDETAKNAAHFLKMRMSLGHAWSIALIAYSVVSRIWILSRQLLKNCCNWYNNLYKCLAEFEAIGCRWLPQDQMLPTDLITWLGIEWINNPIPSVPTDALLRGSMFKLITLNRDDSDEELGVENILPFESSDNVCESVDKDDVKASTYLPDVMYQENKEDKLIQDVGETVSRRKYGQEQQKDKDAAEKLDNANKPCVILTDNIMQKHKFEENNMFDEEIPSKIRRKDHQTSISSIVDKSKSKKLRTLDKVTTMSDLKQVLSQELYPGIDKLRWNMIKNKSKKLLLKSEKEEEQVTTLSLKKIVRRIQKWIT